MTLQITSYFEAKTMKKYGWSILSTYPYVCVVTEIFLSRMSYDSSLARLIIIDLKEETRIIVLLLIKCQLHCLCICKLWVYIYNLCKLWKWNCLPWTIGRKKNFNKSLYKTVICRLFVHEFLVTNLLLEKQISLYQ